MVVLAALLAAAVPALAQEGPSQDESANGPPSEPATLTFELTVEGDPPADAAFLGLVSGEGGAIRVPLTDSDGDNLYTGSMTTAELPAAYVRDGAYVTIVDDSVVAEDGGPRVIRDFGVVPIDEDETFSASVAFEDEGGVPPGPSPDRTATLSFELTVEGEPPADATFFGSIPAEGCISAPLTDPDGDGVYTGSADVPRFPPGPVPPDAEPVSLPVQMVQANGGAGPCNPTRVIKDFGLVKIDGDKTFEASVDFEGNREDTTTPEGTMPEPDNNGGFDDSGGGSGSSGSGGSGSSDSGSGGSINGGSADGGNSGDSGSNGGGFGDGGSGNGGETGGIRSFLPVGLLPSTGGGMSLMVLGAGALLIGGGLLLRKIFR